VKKYKVLGERVLVQRDTNTETSHVLMPHNVKKKPKTGVILGIGSKVEFVEVGQRVVFNEYAGYALDVTQDLEESTMIVMREDEILAIELEESLDIEE